MAKAAKRTTNHHSTTPEARIATSVDEVAKADNIMQMKRARGQVDGILRMIEEDRYCADIIVQITAARASLQAVAADLLARHLKVCHKIAAENGGAAADKMYQELVTIVSRMAK
jgi:CsoR family transcriptional regulator, copper-sensing transcriptional repressor